MILESTFLLDLIDGDEGAVATAVDLERGGLPVRVPTMTVLELALGVHHVADSEAERWRVQRVLDAYPTVSMDRRIARRAGRLLGQFQTEEIDLRTGEAVVAATAVIYGEALVTPRTVPFQHISGLRIETY